MQEIKPFSVGAHRVGGVPVGFSSHPNLIILQQETGAACASHEAQTVRFFRFWNIVKFDGRILLMPSSSSSVMLSEAHNLSDASDGKTAAARNNLQTFPLAHSGRAVFVKGYGSSW